MLRLLSRGRKAEEGDNEAKKYKKANLGQANQMYYNEELKMWVEKGKEDEARAEKAKLSAPPPPSSVMGTISAASSNTSLATMSDAASVAGGPSVPDFSRRKTLKDRYVSTIPTAPAAGTGSAASPAAPPSQALLPGMAGPKLPGLPGLPGSGPPSFFQPTPAASEAGEMNGGSNLGSMSGLSGLDTSFPGSRNASQPNFFMPGPAAPSSSTTTEDTQGAGGAADSLLDDSQGMRTSSGSGAAAGEQRQSSGGNVLSLRQSSEGTGTTLRESDTSGSGRVPADSGPSIVSLAAWRPTSSPDLSQTASSRAPGGQHVQLLQQQGSSADMEADARAEVSSPTLCPIKQPGEEQHSAQEPWAGASGAGDSAAHMNGFGSSVNPGAGAAEPLANGNHSGPGALEQQHEHGQQQPQALSSQLSAGWDNRPARDPFDAADEAPAASTAWAAEGGEYGWEGAPEGGEWGQSYQADYSSTQQQPQDPLAVGTSGEAGAGWGQHQYGELWGQEGGWGNGVDAAAVGGAADPEGAAATAADANGWQQSQAADGQQPDSYYNQYGMQYGEQYDGQQGQQYVQQCTDHQYSAEGGADMCGQQYAADQAGAVANGDYQQSLQDGAAAFSGYQQPSPAAAGPGSAAEQQPVEVLEPVHPELPGISVAGQGSGSMASPTYAPPGSSGSKGSRGTGRLRHASTPGSPLTHQSSVGALLPQPPRFSVGGVGAQQSLGVDGQAEAAAVILSPQAAAGDPSMLTTIRPSSPYARAVSPLSRTSTGIAEAVVSKQSSGGFPIPSPPSHGGLLGSRATSGIFIPGSTGVLAAGVTSGTKPWQPGAQAEASAAAAAQAPQFLQPQHPMQEQGLVNGYDPAAAAASHSQWLQEQQEQSLGLWHQQQQQAPAAGGSSAAAQVPPFVPGLLESLPRLDAPTGHDKHDMAQHMSASGVAAGLEGRDDHLKAVQRAHPYDQFLAQALSQVNWQAVHFKQPGKLNKLLPWEELEMEQALAEEAQQQESGQGRKSPFWYRQMEFRQKLPPGSMKPSASEPAAMPSHAAIKAIPASAADSAVSQNSARPGWPHQQQQQQQLAQEPQMVGSPLTPARAATTGALGAVAPGGLEQQAEEATPTSKLVPAGAAAAAAAAGGGEQAAADGQQQGWAGWTGQDGQQQQQSAAADGYWQQQQQPYAQQAYAEQYEQQSYDQQYELQSYDQQYDAYGQYAGYGQQGYAEQQQHYQYGYDSSQWQQQQQSAEGGDGVTQEGVSTPAAGWGGTWGSPDPETLETSGATADAPQHPLEEQQQQYEQYDQQLQQQHLDYSAAAADEAAGAWGADDAALDLQLAVAMPEGSPAAAAAGTQQDLHAPEVVAAARAARISTSSLGLESQPSTGRVAAAAAKRIVSEALDNIMQQHRVLEEDADQEVAEAAAADGWEGGEELAAEGSGQQAAEAGDSGDGYADESAAAATNLPAAWVKLAQQFAAAADAADAMGALGPELAQYRDYFVQYGDYLLGALPHAALEQAGLLVEEPATAAAAAASPGGIVVAAEASQQLGDEDQEEFFAEFGSLQIKNDISAGLFSALGYDIDSLLACCSEA